MARVDVFQLHNEVQDEKVRLIDTHRFKDGLYQLEDGYKFIVDKNDNVLNVVTNKYKLYQHEEFYSDTLDKLYNLGLNFEIESANWDKQGKRNRLHLRFRFPEISFDVDGSPTVATFEAYNGVDGRMGVRNYLGAYRLICSNGLVLGKTFFYLYKKHMGSDFHKKVKEHDKILMALEEFESIGEMIEQSQTVKATKQFIQKLSDAGFPTKIIKDEFVGRLYEYCNNYNERINPNLVYAYYALLTNWLSHEVARKNLQRQIYLSQKLDGIIRKEIG